MECSANMEAAEKRQYGSKKEEATNIKGKGGN